MTINELYQENEELRNTVSFIRSQLLDQHRPSRAPSPSRQRPTTLDGVSESDMLTMENKDLREKVPSFVLSLLSAFFSPLLLLSTRLRSALILFTFFIYFFIYFFLLNKFHNTFLLLPLFCMPILF